MKKLISNTEATTGKKQRKEKGTIHSRGYSTSDNMKCKLCKCKLCLKEAKLVRSHIIPEFMYDYSGLYDAKHRFIKVGTIEDRTRFKYKQKGFREPLLCERCESTISKWEEYAQKTLLGGHDSKYANQTGQRCGTYVLFRGIDYKKFKLFLLSVLWRASVTNLNEFSLINLGPHHEERIRKMLLEENPGDEDDYGCIITAVMLKDKVMRGIISPFEPIKIRGHNCCRIFIGGLFYVFFISKHSILYEVKQLFLNKLNELRILTKEFEKIPFLTGLIEDVFQEK